jgi:hypothetical protein
MTRRGPRLDVAAAAATAPIDRGEIDVGTVALGDVAAARHAALDIGNPPLPSRRIDGFGRAGDFSAKHACPTADARAAAFRFDAVTAKSTHSSAFASPDRRILVARGKLAAGNRGKASMMGVRGTSWVASLGLALAAGTGWAAPAHYVVFEVDAVGSAVPVFHARVEMSVDRDVDTQRVLRSDRGTERVRYRLIRDGTLGVERQVEVPRYLRAEFAREPESPDGRIELHPDVEDPARAFVLRVPVADADSLELLLEGGAQRIDLLALERDAATLPLAGTAPARPRSEARTPDSAGGASNPPNRVDILVLGDGYTAAEQATFATHAAALRSRMFDVSPYKEYANFVNWQTGFVASVDSGADHPPYLAGCTTGACCADTPAQSDPRAGTFVATALDAKFCTSQLHRLLTVSNAKVYAAAAGFPDWDRILVTVNDPVYGGAGGGFSVTSAHTSGPLVVIHEYAHSFHRLADEYESPYPGFPACTDAVAASMCEANVTDQTSAALVKWRSLFSPGIAIPTPSGTAGTGLFLGARYVASGMYRPVHGGCLMRTLGSNFCPVCRQAYVKRLYSGGYGIPASGIDLIEPGSESPSPAAPVTVAIDTTQVFSADILRPSIGNITLQWWLDGAPIAGATTDSHAFTPTASSAPMRTLQLRATDQTSLVHPDMSEGLLEHTRTWTIQVSTGQVFSNGFE